MASRHLQFRMGDQPKSLDVGSWTCPDVGPPAARKSPLTDLPLGSRHKSRVSSYSNVLLTHGVGSRRCDDSGHGGAFSVVRMRGHPRLDPVRLRKVGDVFPPSLLGTTGPSAASSPNRETLNPIAARKAPTSRRNTGSSDSIPMKASSRAAVRSWTERPSRSSASKHGSPIATSPKQRPLAA